MIVEVIHGWINWLFEYVTVHEHVGHLALQFDWMSTDRSEEAEIKSFQLHKSLLKV